jgi:integrase
MIAALDTEMRRGEMLKLRFADVDFSRGLITLPGGNTKRKKTRLVAFSTQRLCAVVKWLHRCGRRSVDDFVFTNEVGEPLGAFRTV